MMRNLRSSVRTAAIAIAAVLGLSLLCSPAWASINGSPGTQISDLFQSNLTGSSYEYGPSMIVDSAGIHVYSCSPGSYANQSDWDYIRYTNSTDGGHTWSPEQIVLQPSPGMNDALSTCDPGVVAFGGYYYLAYTSTQDPVGNLNNVYVARSTSMTGPFDKWNGTGWGGNPAPIVTYTGPSHQYGAGEPALVVKDSTLYVYYSWYSVDSTTGKYIDQTRVATAPLGTNWPSSLTYQGVAINKTSGGADSSDVKYVPAWGKFLAVNAARRFSAQSYVEAWESTDGITFSPATLNSDNLTRALSNVGLSGNASGQLDPTAQNYIAYAYGQSWSNWSMGISPISFTDDTLPAVPRLHDLTALAGSALVDFQTDSKASSYTVRYGTSPDALTSSVTGVTASPYTLTGLTNGTTYYVALTATGTAGTSAVGNVMSATPLAYSTISPLTATASSSMPGLGASNAVDGSTGTFWSSAGHTSNQNPEWLTVDTGSVHNVGRVVVTPRQPMAWAGPSFNQYQWSYIQTSTDGTTWTTLDTRLSVSGVPDSSGVLREVINLPNAVQTRYVRVMSNLLNSDDYGNYYLQIAEMEVDAVPGGPVASSAQAAFPTSSLTDNNSATFYSSNCYPSGTQSEWAGVDLGSAQTVSRFAVTPRVSALGFPVDFAIQTSSDGSTWTSVPGQTYTGFANPGSADVSFTFNPVVTRYVRLAATRLGADDHGNYCLQFVNAWTSGDDPATATASSSVGAANGPDKAVDGLGGTSYWSSVGHATASATESLTLDLGTNRPVQEILLTPRDGYGFPRAFSIQSSTDGVTWTTLPGQSYGDYPDPSLVGTTPNPVQVFHLGTAVSMRYVRVVATTLRADNYGTYYFQLAGVTVSPLTTTFQY
jgi:F5/8 type C domain